jgi:rhomboid protease GluP
MDMQQQTDIQTLMDRGTDLLKSGRLTEAASAFAQAAQLDPKSTAPHLGLAETNLALGDYGMAVAASRQVIELNSGSADAYISRAILGVVEGNFDAALAAIEQAIQLDPGQPYAHALRGYCLRQLGQRYEGALAEARAARGWGSRDFDHLFPKHTPAAETEPQTQQRPPQQDVAPGMPQRIRYDQQRNWNTRSPWQRRMVRLRFLFGGIPVVTMTLLIANIVVYLACAILGGDLFNPFHQGYLVRTDTGLFISAPNPLYSIGVAQGLLIQHNPAQIYRLLTSMFLHEGIVHIGVNMLSLYFVGVVTERVFGTWRFTLIYFAAGIAGALAQALLDPTSVSLGASGAIFGIFGAFGAFVLLRRQAFGAAGGAIISQWLLWLGINLYLTLSDPQIAKYDHFGGLFMGFALGVVLVITARKRRAYV